MGAEPVPIRPLSAPGAGSSGLGGVHQEMVDAVLAGDGVERVAELASVRVGRPVAIVAPAHGVSVLHPPPQRGDLLGALQSYEAARIDGRATELPKGVELVTPILSGEEVLGSVAMLKASGRAVPEAAELLHLTAIATLTALALEEAREQAEAKLGIGLIEQLRRGEIDGAEVPRRAARLGCDLARGAVVLACDAGKRRPREAAALISSEYPGAIAQLVDGHVYAVLPASGGDEAPELTVSAAVRLAERLRGYGQSAISSFYVDPGDLTRALQEAELVLGVISRDEQVAGQLQNGAGSGVYRLLFRALASHPEEVRSFYEDTVAAIVNYDQQYHTDLLATLESYLANDCNMNATARAIYAHRHTVAYRLQRVKELTGLDPMISEARERLSLGIKAYRIVAPTLPR